ncbi:MAG: GIY-YIG nuclease family protein [Opitutaceae bacterium]|nr:GIY-YIG nuclease family protein [Opitutaceae bacterium]
MLCDSLAAYNGRIVIDWGPGFRAWVQRADSKDKTIVEIRRSISDPPFPGFLDFREHLSRLATVPVAWREALSSVCGIYLLTCPTTGRCYVGSAGGERGFWGRWENYVSSGHGGNRRMKRKSVTDYQVSVLEVSASSVSTEELLTLESRWKEKLLSRKFGLNGN